MLLYTVRDQLERESIQTINCATGIDNQTHNNPRLHQQEAQLSQRDCVMHRVIEYFAKSLKVIRNDTAE